MTYTTGLLHIAVAIGIALIASASSASPTRPGREIVVNSEVVLAQATTTQLATLAQPSTQADMHNPAAPAAEMQPSMTEMARHMDETGIRMQAMGSRLDQEGQKMQQSGTTAPGIGPVKTGMAMDKMEDRSRWARLAKSNALADVYAQRAALNRLRAAT